VYKLTTIGKRYSVTDAELNGWIVLSCRACNDLDNAIGYFFMANGDRQKAMDDFCVVG